MGTDMGHIHLQVANLGDAERFYVDVLGFDVVLEMHSVSGRETTGDILFVPASSYHHHGFNMC